MLEPPLVVGVDMSAEAQRALATAFQLAHRLGCGVVVVHAVGLLEEGGYRPPPPLDELLAAARATSPIEVSDVPVEVPARMVRPPTCSCASRSGSPPRC
ncbi:MAG: universal stress protein [Ilumatobacteraceae bacterium]